jgi:formylglycine-generating enzyme required for sulfatase activity
LDGGFLPSEAEWSYAAAGGSQQRAYPWSNPSTSTSIDCPDSNFGGAIWPSTACVQSGTNLVGSEPKGDARWGQSDMAGNVSEWALDWYVDPYPPGDCTNCANLSPGTYRLARGGAFLTSSALWVLNAFRGFAAPDERRMEDGARCARTP